MLPARRIRGHQPKPPISPNVRLWLSQFVEIGMCIKLLYYGFRFPVSGGVRWQTRSELCFIFLVWGATYYGGLTNGLGNGSRIVSLIICV